MFKFNKQTGKKQDRFICRFGTEILGLGFEAGLSVGELERLKKSSQAVVSGLTDLTSYLTRFRRKIVKKHPKETASSAR